MKQSQPKDSLPIASYELVQQARKVTVTYEFTDGSVVIEVVKDKTPKKK
jgi:hypothetical protein